MDIRNLIQRKLRGSRNSLNANKVRESFFNLQTNIAFIKKLYIRQDAGSMYTIANIKPEILATFSAFLKRFRVSIT